MAYEKLFAGNQDRFLTFDPASLKPREEDGKVVPDYRTIKREVSEKVWKQQLGGIASLGLSPLRDGKVKWGAIDIDVYPCLETEDELSEFLKKWNDPCLIARSKSGGVHVIAFTKDWVSAEVMRAYLTAKRDAVLPPELLEHADEIFPKQNEGNGSQMNLPQFGSERPVLAWKSPTFVQYCNTTTKSGDEIGVDWEAVEEQCFVPEAHMASVTIAALTKMPKRTSKAREKKKYAGGFKRPTSGRGMEGRNSYLFSCGASARARGADEDEAEAIIREVNEWFGDPSNGFTSKGPITDERRLETVISQVQKLPQGEVVDLAFDVVERINAEWALMFVDGAAEVLNTVKENRFPCPLSNSNCAPTNCAARKCRTCGSMIPTAASTTGMLSKRLTMRVTDSTFSKGGKSNPRTAMQVYGSNMSETSFAQATTILPIGSCHSLPMPCNAHGRSIRAQQLLCAVDRAVASRSSVKRCARSCAGSR
jgi:hypothetical protein